MIYYQVQSIMGLKYKCKCGHTFEVYLKTNRCTKCENEKITNITPSWKIIIDLPQSKKFIPIYYQDKLWYYRRSARNTKKAKIKALSKYLHKKHSWENLSII